MSQKDFMGAEDMVQFAPSPTDVIISDYENKISQNIATKTLSASKRGKAPDFTKEELLYLNRKAGEDEDTELKVIAPAPLVTLKKGKTELNIGHAVKLVQKMEEKYPTTSVPMLGETMKLSDLPSIVKPRDEDVFEMPTPIQIPPQQEIKTVNKNAYEIRSDILSQALSWVQYKKEFETLKITPTEDEVIEVAQKFYKFVENRR